MQESKLIGEAMDHDDEDVLAQYGGFRDLFEDMWSNLEDYEDSKKG